MSSSWPAVTLAGILLLAGCGSGTGPGAEQTAQPTAAAASPSPRPTSAAPGAPTSGSVTAAPSPTEAVPTPLGPFGTPQGCSTDGGGYDLRGAPALTAEVRRKRRAIVDAAAACDYERLAELAAPDLMAYSFGEGGDPADFWRHREQERNEPVLAILALLLSLRPHVDAASETDTLFTWPRALHDPTPAARAELEEVLSPATVSSWYADGDDYVGPRVGIRADGTWILYAVGD